LPGVGGAVAARNAFKILRSDCANLGRVKIQRLKEYAALFPECAGRFVIFGDDGQADLAVTDQMLSLVDTSYNFLVAWVAIHAVKTGKDDFITRLEDRDHWIDKLRRKHPPLAGAASRHRFFYFTDYEELAVQLSTTGWITPSQRDAVMHAAERDRFLAGLLKAAQGQNMLELTQQLQARCVANDELDEVELNELSVAADALPVITAAHVILTPPNGPSSRARGALEIRVKKVVTKYGSTIDKPYVAARPVDRFLHGKWQGFKTVTVSASRDVFRGDKGIVVKVFKGKSWLSRSYLGHCYIALEQPPEENTIFPAATSVCPTGVPIDIALLGKSDSLEGLKEVGHAVIVCFWVDL